MKLIQSNGHWIKLASKYDCINYDKTIFFGNAV